MSFCIRNTYQAPTVNYLSSESSTKVIFEEKIPITSIESVLKFDMTTNSWVWREMNDNSISSSIGPSGSLVNIQNSEVLNIIENQSTDNIQSKKVETNNNGKNKKRKQKKK
jgi:hypothetical protein